MQKIYLETENLVSRPEVEDKIKLLSAKTILDIGGSYNNWLYKYTTHIFDSCHPHSNKHMPLFHTDAAWFKGDINDHEDWQQIFDYVKENGKFDFVSCTHTLEDLAYPILALKNMPKIAKAGFIAVPSKYWELNRRDIIRGGYHHRWIFNVHDNKILLYPKINMIEYMNAYNHQSAVITKFKDTELRILWDDDLDFAVVNDDFLGPTLENIISFYETLIFYDNDWP